MESLRCMVAQIATTPDSNLHKLPLLHRHAIPILSLVAFVYQLSLSLRRRLYLSGPLSHHRFPVTVISVGNLTWGGNGKTPMTEFVAHTMADTGVSPLVLTRGYAGGNEAEMLHRHLLQTSVKIGVGANTRAVAASVSDRYGYMDCSLLLDKLSSSHSSEPGTENEKVGIVILDDGMQAALVFVSRCGNCYVK